MKIIILSIGLILTTLVVDRLFLYNYYHNDESILEFITVDDHIFDQPENINSNLKVTVKLYRDKKGLQKEYRKNPFNRLDHNTINAFTSLDKKNNKCTIHVLSPATNYEPQYLGHELFHCIYGRWHSK